ncbi:MAG TPA: hypothetical protein VHA56_00285 [Mucilaginibacter sp.]|nr:hypothetical protein [Mucilaginibacter sp.]
METSATTRTCKECGNKLLGRSDQKYCSDQCRTSGNNRIRNEHIHNSVDSRKAINYILINNHRILNNLRKKGFEFSKMYLRDLGFNFRYLTAFEQKDESMINYCYDFGYIVQQDEVRLL